jgi:hypothetical protein
MTRRAKSRTNAAREIDRRALLQALAAGAAWRVFDPITAAIAGIAGGASLQARAGTKADKPRNYVFVYLESAPSRWHFDLPLNPFGGAVPPNPGLNTGFVNGQPAYRTAPVTAAGQTLEMPPLWSGTIPRPGGGEEAAARLLDNALIIRGCDMASDGHNNNRIRQIYPLAGAPSLNGLVADSSTAPLPAVTLAGGLMDEAYFSQGGVGILAWNSQDASRNALQQFLDPFVLDKKVSDHPLFQDRKALDKVIEATLAKMQSATARRQPGAGGVFRDRASATKLLNTELGNIADTYNGLFAKYRDLITQCATKWNLVGVNDQVVNTGALQSPHRNSVLNGAQVVALENPDLRTILKGDSTIMNMAEGFAVAEYLLLQDYGAAINICAGLPLNFNMVVGGAPQNMFYFLDEHLQGTATSVLAMGGFYFRAVAACIYELSQVLKAKGKWEDTVIHVGSEFSRSPRSDGSGSDHGWEANVTSVYSGAIKKPMILGNTRVSASDSLAAAPVYGGAWGAAANVDHDKTIGHLNIGHVSSTIATLLRVERPMNNFASVVEAKDNGVEAVIESAKNV